MQRSVTGHDAPHLLRRHVLAFAAGGLAAPSATFAGSSAGVLADYIRVRSALDGRLVIGGQSGRYVGVVDGVQTPLFGVVSAVFSRAKPNGASGFDIAEYEQAYFTSLETGEALTSWRNPFTAEVLSVPVAAQAGRRLTIRPDLVFDTPAPEPGALIDHHVNRMEGGGHDLIFVEHISVRIEAAEGKAGFSYKEATTLTASRATVRAAPLHAGCATTFDAVVSWRPWMKMADRPGHLAAHGRGRYGVAIGDLPPAWIAATRIANPELLSRPAVVVARL